MCGAAAPDGGRGCAKGPLPAAAGPFCAACSHLHRRWLYTGPHRPALSMASPACRRTERLARSAVIAVAMAAAVSAAAAPVAPHLPYAHADVYSGYGFYAEHPASWAVADTWDSDGRVAFSVGGGGDGAEPGAARIVVSLLEGYEVATRDGSTEGLKPSLSGQDLLDEIVRSSKAMCQYNVRGACWFYELDDSKLVAIGDKQAASVRFSATIDDLEVTVRELVLPAGMGGYWVARGVAGEGGPVGEMEAIISAFATANGVSREPTGADEEARTGRPTTTDDPEIVLEKTLRVNLLLVGDEWSRYDKSILDENLPSYYDPLFTAGGEKAGIRYLYEYNFVSIPDSSGLVDTMDDNSAVRPLFGTDVSGGALLWLGWWVHIQHPEWIEHGYAGSRPGSEPEYRLVDAEAVEEYVYETMIASDPDLADPASANLVFLAAGPDDVGYLYSYGVDGHDKATGKPFTQVGMMGYGGNYNMYFFDLYSVPWIDIDTDTFEYALPEHLDSLHDYDQAVRRDRMAGIALMHTSAALRHIVTPSFLYPVEYHDQYLVDVLVYVEPGSHNTITPASLRHIISEKDVLAELEYLYPYAEWRMQMSVERRDLRGVTLDFKKELEHGERVSWDASEFGPAKSFRLLDTDDIQPHLVDWASGRIGDRGGNGERVIPVLIVVGTSDHELALDDVGGIGLAPSMHGREDVPCCVLGVADDQDIWGKGVGLSDLVLHEVGHVLGLHHPFVSFDRHGGGHYNWYYNWYASPMTYSLPSVSIACGNLFGIMYDEPCGNPSLSFTPFERSSIADARMASLLKKVDEGLPELDAKEASAARRSVDESLELFRTGDTLSARGALPAMIRAHAAVAGAPGETGASPPASTPAPPDASVPTTVPLVPAWVKSSAGWWADGMIDDSDFVNGIGFLIDTGVIAIGPRGGVGADEPRDAPPSGGSATGYPTVPGWVKMSAGWWAKDMISEAEFVRGMEFLVSEGIIRAGR